MSKTKKLVRRLKAAGFSSAFVQSSLPEWWDEQAEESDSAWQQMQLDLAQRLSLDPFTLIDESKPLQFSDTGRPKYKHLSLPDAEQRVVSGFAAGLARILVGAIAEHRAVPSSGVRLRDTLLRTGAPWVGLPELLQTCYSLGIPVVHLTKFPTALQGMAAMTTSVGGRFVIFTARAPLHPSQLAFFVAHELGHIALGHVGMGGSLIEGPLMSPDAEPSSDTEEAEADAYAFELLTGKSTFRVSADPGRGTATELTHKAVDAGSQLAVDPGLVILCYARSTSRWETGVAALKKLPNYDKRIVARVNHVLRGQLDQEMLSSEDKSYLDEVAAV